MNGTAAPFKRSYPNGTAIRKNFDGVMYTGTVMWRRTPFHRIAYNDGDYEDLDPAEMASVVVAPPQTQLRSVYTPAYVVAAGLKLLYDCVSMICCNLI